MLVRTGLGILDLRPGSKDLCAYNIERVRAYLENHLGCRQCEVVKALGLNRATVRKAIKVINGVKSDIPYHVGHRRWLSK